MIWVITLPSQWLELSHTLCTRETLNSFMIKLLSVTCITVHGIRSPYLMMWKWPGAIFVMNILNLIHKHGPVWKFRLKGWNNTWLYPEIGNFIKHRDATCAKALKTTSANDWLFFRQLRNKCTSLIKKAKAGSYLTETTRNLNDQKKFWKVVKWTSGAAQQNELPNFMVKTCQFNW